MREVPKDDRRRIKALWDGNFCSLSTALRCTAHCSSNASSKALPRNRGAPKSSTPVTSTLVNAQKGGSCVSDISGAYTSHLDWLRHRPIEVSSSVMVCRSWAIIIIIVIIIIVIISIILFFTATIIIIIIINTTIITTTITSNATATHWRVWGRLVKNIGGQPKYWDGGNGVNA